MEKLRDIFLERKLGQVIIFHEEKESAATSAWKAGWDAVYVVRDLLQNFFDANKIQEVKIEVEGSNVSIFAPTDFNLERLYYIGSEKDGIKTIGQYGEGFKIAAVHLLNKFNVEPICVSRNMMLHIKFSERPIPETETLFPLIYTYAKMDAFYNGTLLILQNCSSDLIDVFKRGFENFFFENSHPLIGRIVFSNGSVSIYKSKDGKGYVYYDKLLRGFLNENLPFVFSFNRKYKKIDSLIGNDRDRKTFRNADANIFFTQMSFGYSETKKILELTKETLWGIGKTHTILKRLKNAKSYHLGEIDPIFKEDYFASSNSYDKTFRDLEEKWVSQGKIRLPYYFKFFGAMDAELFFRSEIIKTERKNARLPTKAESAAITFLRDIMYKIVPEFQSVFLDKLTTYVLGETEEILGLLRNKKYGKNEVYLSAKMFLEDFYNIFPFFIHEHSHIKGADGSREFSDILTEIIGRVLRFSSEVTRWETEWNKFREDIENERR